MNEQWVKVYSTTQHHQIEIARAILEENHINSSFINKMSTSYGNLIGEIELYVKADDETLASFILKNIQL